MNSKKIQYILILVISWIYPTYTNADVSKLLLAGTDVCCFINIYGEIKNDDIKSLEKAITQFKTHKEDYEKIYKLNTLTFKLMSLGGDVQTAITMGRILRSHDAVVSIPTDSTCASACVLIYAGGTLRAKWGELLIHRPYSTITGERTTSDIQKERERIKNIIETYLTEVNVSTRLYEIMDSIPPKNSRKLTDNELKLLKLDMLDPVAEEQADSSEAARLNLSRQDYYKKQNECKEHPYKSHAWKGCMK